MAIALDDGVETLYVGGPQNSIYDRSARLGTLDLATFVFAGRAVLDGQPELTGSADGHLWGFFPHLFAADARVEDLDKTTGSALRTIELAAINSYDGDYAFAAWGGDLWIFVGAAKDGPTAVFRLTRATSKLMTAIADTGRHIVGVGVAPCAP
jgi:hypothetical protein